MVYVIDDEQYPRHFKEKDEIINMVNLTNKSKGGR
jgi:hypothetical protein